MQLPLKFNDGREVSKGLLEQTREDVIAQFGALSAQSHYHKESLPYPLTRQALAISADN